MLTEQWIIPAEIRYRICMVFSVLIGISSTSF